MKPVDEKGAGGGCVVGRAGLDGDWAKTSEAENLPTPTHET